MNPERWDLTNVPFGARKGLPEQSGAWMGRVTVYEKQLLEALARAKCARTEEERARFFRTAEELSERARNAGKSSAESGN